MKEQTVAAHNERLEILENALIESALEGWRFARVFGRLVTKLDAGEATRYAGQLRYYAQRLEDSLGTAGLSLVNLEGQPYDPGMAATALNVADFGADDRLVVHQMVEPVIMGPEGLRRTGVVMLRKADA
jgi:hypothetical protein